jgi:hypothetical protein
VLDLQQHRLRSLAWLTLAACAPGLARAQDTTRRITYGMEVAIRSGHADRGFIINDRPVIQPVVWLSGSGTELSVWSSFPLAQTTYGARPEIFELEVVRELDVGRLSIGPGLRMYLYHDRLNADRSRSLEAWLYLSYQAGPVRLFTNHSFDVQTHKGAYFVDAGIESERSISEGLDIGGLIGAGFGSWKFNDAYAGVATTALDRITAEAWLTASFKRLYISPHVEYSTIVDRAVRAGDVLPSFMLFRVAVGGEF